MDYKWNLPTIDLINTIFNKTILNVGTFVFCICSSNGIRYIGLWADIKLFEVKKEVRQHLDKVCLFIDKLHKKAFFYNLISYSERYKLSLHGLRSLDIRWNVWKRTPSIDQRLCYSDVSGDSRMGENILITGDPGG